jgi:hypothetical protein
MSESEDKNEYESDANDPQTFASLFSKEAVHRTIGEALEVATPVDENSIDEPNEDDDDDNIDTVQKKVCIT